MEQELGGQENGVRGPDLSVSLRRRRCGCSCLLCPSAVLSALGCWWLWLEINERRNFFSVRKAKAYVQVT